MRIYLLLGSLVALLSCGIAENAVDRTTFDVQGETLFMAGEITTQTPRNFSRVLAENPQLTTVVQTVMPGSLDDEAVLKMGYALRERGLDTRLTAESEIYSGAVDLFLAGNSRSMAQGAVIGVHSWTDGFGEGTDYPPNAPEHRSNVAYTTDMLGSAEFYWFTLQAAPSDGIHEMTEAEIARYGLLTEPIQN